MKVVVTGGAGRLGGNVTAHLRSHGHTVTTVDIVPVDGAPHGTHTVLDLTRLGETVEAIHGADAVIHLGAIWAAGIRTDSETFQTNVLSTSNVFSAAVLGGASRVIWASTGAVTGSPFGWGDPSMLPIDENTAPRPQSAYALSKYVGEMIAPYFAETGGLSILGMRLGWILHQGGYSVVAEWGQDPMSRRFNAFVYADVRDVAEACRRGLDSPFEGAHVVSISAADTCIDRPSAQLAEEAFPSATLSRPLEGYESLVSIQRARELIGYEPQRSWRTELA